LDTTQWTAEAFPGWNQDWQKSLEVLPGESESDLGCDEWETQPTLLIQRDTFANMFHDSEDFFNTFIALAILQWNTDNLQIIIADLYPKGPFWEMWTRVFSNAGRRIPLTAWDLKTKYGAKKVCYKVKRLTRRRDTRLLLPLTLSVYARTWRWEFTGPRRPSQWRRGARRAREPPL